MIFGNKIKEYTHKERTLCLLLSKLVRFFLETSLSLLYTSSVDISEQ